MGKLFDLTVFIDGAKEMKAKLGLMVRDSDDLSPVFEYISWRFRAGEKKLFAGTGNYGGNPEWEKLSDKYGAWKAKHHPGKPLMVLSNRLRRSLTIKDAEDSVLEIGKTRMTIGTSVAYAAAHQKGSAKRHLPKRRVVVVSKQDVRDWAAQIGLHLRRSLGPKEYGQRRIAI